MGNDTTSLDLVQSKQLEEHSKRLNSLETASIVTSADYKAVMRTFDSHISDFNDNVKAQTRIQGELTRSLMLLTKSVDKSEGAWSIAKTFAILAAASVISFSTYLVTTVSTHTTNLEVLKQEIRILHKYDTKE
jgi:hypothetical protein